MQISRWAEQETEYKYKFNNWCADKQHKKHNIYSIFTKIERMQKEAKRYTVMIIIIVLKIIMANLY